MANKKFEEWEKHFGFISKIYDPKNKDHQGNLTEDQFRDLTMQNLEDVTGVNHEDRAEFLKANGYELTRENMSNPELSARPTNTESE